MYDVVVRSSRSLSHLLMSSCLEARIVKIILPVYARFQKAQLSPEDLAELILKLIDRISACVTVNVVPFC